MPAYNAEATIAESIAAIQSQSHVHWELLLLVDASTDQTLPIAQAFAAADTRIRLMAGKKNRGVTRARNICLRLVTGQWIAFCDADDFWKADKLERQFHQLRLANANFCYTLATYWRADKNWESVPTQLPAKLSLARLLKGNAIGMSTVLLEQSLLNGVYFDKLPAGIVHEDYAFWLKVFRNTSCNAVCLFEPTTKVSIHPATRSGNKLRAMQSQFYILRKYGQLSVLSSVAYLFTYLLLALYKRGIGAWIRQLQP